MKFTCFLTILTLVLFDEPPLHATEKMNVVRIEFEGHQYENLYLFLWLNDHNQKSIRGQSAD
jgi:hypothetical protein